MPETLGNEDGKAPVRPDIVMFYDGFERKARENAVARVYHAVRSQLRATVRRARGKQVNTGFYEAFLALVAGLERLGHRVRVNDFAFALAHSDYPIGIGGYPDVISHVDLPNPIIFGPGDPGYPDAAADFAKRENVRRIIQPSDWFVDYYRPYCGDVMMCCPVGIDVDTLPDGANHPKSIDMLVYDKIRWHRETKVPAVLDRLLRALDARGLSHETVRYGEHKRDDYLAKLRVSRAMAFICEHETQGLACEEALAMNVPVFAWEEGELVDPLQRPFAADDLIVSSVPYFDDRCGMTFRADDLEERLDRFVDQIGTYRPRAYITEHLRPSDAARVYRDAYCALLPD